MARDFLTPIDMNGNEVRNFLLPNLAVDPASPDPGQPWFNTTDGVARYFDGTDVIDITESIGAHTHPQSEVTNLVADLAAINTAIADRATPADVAAAIAALVDGAPGLLDTFNEIANALGDDPNFATTITSMIADKPDKHAETVGGATSIPVVHNLNTRDVVISVHSIATNEEVECDKVKTDVNTVTLGFTVAPAAASLRVTVIG